MIKGSTKNDIRYFTYLGETKALKTWGKDARSIVSVSCLRKRIHEGWDFERAFTTPPSNGGLKPKTLFTFEGETKSIPEWALDERCLVGVNTLYGRIRKYGWDFDRAFSTPSQYDITEAPIDIDQKFGKLTILGKGERNKNGQQLWLCLCECGNTISARSWHLRNGNYTSCGCMLAQRATETFLKYRKNYSSDFPYGFNEVYSTYKKGAKCRNLEFVLSKDEFYTLSQKNCYYCDSLPNNKKSREKDFMYSGIDRKDNNIGYTVDNSVACCKICNVAKNNLEFQDFLDQIEKIYTNLKNKNII